MSGNYNASAENRQQVVFAAPAASYSETSGGCVDLRLLPTAHCRLSVKQVVAIVKPFLVEKLLDGLRRAPLEAVVVREVKGMGKQKSYLDQYADSEYSHAFLPKVEVTLWVEENRAEEVVQKMIEITRTGRMGDGKIWVMSASPYDVAVTE